MEEIVTVLEKIVDVEKRLKKVQLSPSSSFSVEINDKLEIHIDGEVFSSKNGRQLVHQVDYRLIPDFDRLFKPTHDNTTTSGVVKKTEVANRIAEALKKNRSILLLDIGKKTIYGVVSDQFCEINQLEFRSKFIDAYKEIGLSEISENGVGQTSFGEPIEIFSFNALPKRRVGEPIKYGSEVIYGLNNGISPFRIAVSRTILVCANGLTRVQNLSFAKLTQTKDYDINGFINNIKNNIIEYDDYLQKLIDASKHRNLNPSFVNELFDRLHVATVVKNRIKEQLDIEKSKTGETEWSLSQAFTFLSSHFYNHSFYERHNQRVLEEVGSNIIDNSLEYLLDQDVKETSYFKQKTWGNLLPRDFHSN